MSYWDKLLLKLGNFLRIPYVIKYLPECIQLHEINGTNDTINEIKRIHNLSENGTISIYNRVNAFFNIIIPINHFHILVQGIANRVSS